MKRSIFLFVLMSIAYFSNSQSTFYDLNTIQKIEIYFSSSTWDFQLDTARYGQNNYIVADWIKINNYKLDSVGVRYKGNISFDSTYQKNPLHIELDFIKNQTYQNFTDIKLSNGYGDPSFIREVLSYSILSYYMPCPKANFAQVYINGSYYGLYSNIENIGKRFCHNRFGSSENTFIKCSPVVNPSPAAKSNLKYLNSTDSSAYFNYYQLKSVYGWNDFVELCNNISNHPELIDSVLDIDKVLWMLAFDNLLVNLDSYLGVFAQNYYLYKDNNNQYNPVVWDLNMSFGGFPHIGYANSSMGSLTISDMQQLSPTVHANDAYWPVIKTIMNNPTFKKIYFAHLRTIANDFFINELYKTKAQEIQRITDTALQSDINKFFTYEQFQNGLTENYAFGSYFIPGIANLMESRISYLQSNADFNFPAPVITDVFTNKPNSTIGSEITFTAKITNSTSVFLAYRYNKFANFTKIHMKDDGTEYDLFAGDNIFTASLTIENYSTQYYIYAENNEAASFSPERAEFEFYTQDDEFRYSKYNEIVINEFVASNKYGVENEFYNSEDWIELYNTTNENLRLSNLYISDNYSNSDKFKFPENTIIEANNYLILWADYDTLSTSDIHTGFKLTASAEQIILSDGFGEIIDSVSFKNQLTDISYGRCPNGNGEFQFLSNVTFASENCVKPSDENAVNLHIYPNPAKDAFSFSVTTQNFEPEKIIIRNLNGQILKIYNVITDFYDISFLQSGVYIISFISTKNEIVNLRIVKI